MALNTSTFLALKLLFNQAINDDLRFNTTTNIADSKLVVSTTLNAYDDAENGYFDDWWVEITDGTLNLATERKIGSTTYATSSGTLYVWGADLSAESATRACRLHRYEPARKTNAILRAIEELYPTLHLDIDNQTLVTGNRLKDGHFESWTDATTPVYYTKYNAGGAFARTTTGGLTRGGTYSLKYTAGAADDYFDIDSETYPELLELKGRTASFYAQVQPEAANDGKLEIYTLKTDGTTSQTLTSTTTNPTGVFTQLKLESQAINDDLDYISIRFKTTTSGKYTVWDDAYLGDRRLCEYLLPDDFVGGELIQVWVQTEGESDELFYDLHPFTHNRGKQISFDIVSDGADEYLVIGTVTNERRLRLIGDKPLETLSTGASTITLDAHRIPLIIAKARMIFWEREAVPVTADDKSKFEHEYNKATRDFTKLLHKRMPRPLGKDK